MNYGQFETRPVKMSQIEKVGHAVMIICTFGLWLPIYLVRKSKFKGRTITRPR